MPTKHLVSPFGRDGFTHRSYKFGGGADTIFTATTDEFGAPFLIGYNIDTGGGYNIDAGGGNDIIYGSDIGTPGSGIGDNLTGGDGDDMIFGGGGDDTINGGNTDGTADSSKGQKPAPTNTLVGDGERQADGSLTADVNFLNGPVFDGGYDEIIGGLAATTNTIYGDAANVNMGVDSVFNGGEDVLRGGDDTISNSLYGDAKQLTMVASSTFNGGSDYLRGGDSTDPNGVNVFNNLFGDAQGITMNVGIFDGGDDTLVGGSGTGFVLAGSIPIFDVTNTMAGDTGSVGGLGAGFQGGNDTLISGTFAVDNIWGDWASGATGGEIGGEDIFVFGLNNGRDTINDFRSADDDDIGASPDMIGDTINLAGMGLSFATFDTSGDPFGGPNGVLDAGDWFITITAEDSTIIDLGLATGTAAAGIHTVTVAGVTGLTAGDFDFVNVIDPDMLLV